jgi:hypothetical protein
MKAAFADYQARCPEANVSELSCSPGCAALKLSNHFYRPKRGGGYQSLYNDAKELRARLREVQRDTRSSSILSLTPFSS